MDITYMNEIDSKTKKFIDKLYVLYNSDDTIDIGHTSQHVSIVVENSIHYYHKLSDKLKDLVDIDTVAIMSAYHEIGNISLKNKTHIRKLDDAGLIDVITSPANTSKFVKNQRHLLGYWIFLEDASSGVFKDIPSINSQNIPLIANAIYHGRYSKATYEDDELSRFLQMCNRLCDPCSKLIFTEYYISESNNPLYNNELKHASIKYLYDNYYGSDAIIRLKWLEYPEWMLTLLLKNASEIAKLTKFDLCPGAMGSDGYDGINCKKYFMESIILK